MARNIVLLSDGTGNSAAKFFKTNVWRMYQALDLTNARQVAFYDDGVGTSSFKPLAIIGGAFGWGLKRNIIAMYMFLCENYAAGDQIFLFGFSRGAFTVRVLARFFLAKGLVSDFDSRDDLRRKARKLYRDFRAEQSQQRSLSRLIQSLVYFCARSFDPQDITTQPVSDINFLGVWDTVDAYGLPIEELKKGFDRFIWPLALNDRELDPKICKACHALSIDDQRTSFHPLLWDESDNRNHPRPDHTDNERLTQVWFAGAHSNVGGGYPDDSLSIVSLWWMMAEAIKRGLILLPQEVDATKRKRAPFGKIYDSRAGFGAYYRYRTRAFPAVDKQNAMILNAKLHESAVWRLAIGLDQYAPFNVNGDFAITLDPTQGDNSDCRRQNVYSLEAYQRAAQSQEAGISGLGDASEQPRFDAQLQQLMQPDENSRRLALDTAWWKSKVSLLTYLATAILVFFPIWHVSIPIEDTVFVTFGSADATRNLLAAIGSVLASPILGVIDSVNSIAPSFLQKWFDGYREAPLLFGWCVAGLVVLLVWSSSLDRRIQDRALATWKWQWRARRYEWWKRHTRFRMMIGIPLAGLSAFGFLYVALHARILTYFWWKFDAFPVWFLADIDLLPILTRVLLPLLFVLGFLFATAMFWIMRGWKFARRSGGPAIEEPGLALLIARRIASSNFVQGIARLVAAVIPATFALSVTIIAFALASKLSFAVMSAGGWLCDPSPTSQSLLVGELKEFHFSAKYGCQATGISLEYGAIYQIDIENMSGTREIRDGSIVEDERPPGSWYEWKWKAGLATRLALLFRRYWSAPWFQPIIRVGTVNGKEMVLDQSDEAIDIIHVRRMKMEPPCCEEEITVEERWRRSTNTFRVDTGEYDFNRELFVFVNDAVIAIPWLWDVFYLRNNAEGTLVVRKLTAGCPLPGLSHGKPAAGC